jgi:predicted deacetylase
MSARYLIRLDDACPTMDRTKWDRMEQILDRYGIRPIVAVIPQNTNPLFQAEKPDPTFWEKAQRWQQKNWVIGLHGFDHMNVIPEAQRGWMKRSSEFEGLPLTAQREKIRQGWTICLENGIRPQVWVAPWHTFDSATLAALLGETPIRTISDGIAWSTYSESGFRWVPVQLWSYVPFAFGTYTICLHPHEMTEQHFLRLERTLVAHRNAFIAWTDLKPDTRARGLHDRLFDLLHRSYRMGGSIRRRLRPKIVEEAKI